MPVYTKHSILLCALVLAACGARMEEPPAGYRAASGPLNPDYVIGPLDELSVFVWQNPEVSTKATVRPDGRVTLPLVEDLPASRKTSAQLARDIERELAKYIQDPQVTVTVGGFNGPFSEQIRIVGEAAKPSALPYRADMTILDVMIAVGGLTEFADGNSTALVRTVEGEPKRYRVRLRDLLQEGDVTANVPVLPGDVVIIPQSWL